MFRRMGKPPDRVSLSPSVKGSIGRLFKTGHFLMMDHTIRQIKYLSNMYLRPEEDVAFSFTALAYRQKLFTLTDYREVSFLVDTYTRVFGNPGARDPSHPSREWLMMSADRNKFAQLNGGASHHSTAEGKPPVSPIASPEVVEQPVVAQHDRQPAPRPHGAELSCARKGATTIAEVRSSELTMLPARERRTTEPLIELGGNDEPCRRDPLAEMPEVIVHLPRQRTSYTQRKVYNYLLLPESDNERAINSPSPIVSAVGADSGNNVVRSDIGVTVNTNVVDHGDSHSASDNDDELLVHRVTGDLSVEGTNPSTNSYSSQTSSVFGDYEIIEKKSVCHHVRTVSSDGPPPSVSAPDASLRANDLPRGHEHTLSEGMEKSGLTTTRKIRPRGRIKESAFKVDSSALLQPRKAASARKGPDKT